MACPTTVGLPPWTRQSACAFGGPWVVHQEGAIRGGDAGDPRRMSEQPSTPRHPPCCGCRYDATRMARRHQGRRRRAGPKWKTRPRTRTKSDMADVDARLPGDESTSTVSVLRPVYFLRKEARARAACGRERGALNVTVPTVIARQVKPIRTTVKQPNNPFLRRSKYPIKPATLQKPLSEVVPVMSASRRLQCTCIPLSPAAPSR